MGSYHCVVNYFPDDPAASLNVPLDDLADRVIELYWRQALPLTVEGVDADRDPATVAIALNMQQKH